MRQLMAILTAFLALPTPGAPAPVAGQAAEGSMSFTVVNVEYEGTKIRVRGTLVVKWQFKVQP